jgi:hypothetical protein
VWSIALAIDSVREARASDLVEHTNELGGSSSGTSACSGVDADGELSSSYSRGVVLKIIGRRRRPLRRPAAHHSGESAQSTVQRCRRSECREPEAKRRPVTSCNMTFLAHARETP